MEEIEALFAHGDYRPAKLAILVHMHSSGLGFDEDAPLNFENEVEVVDFWVDEDGACIVSRPIGGESRRYNSGCCSFTAAERVLGVWD